MVGGFQNKTFELHKLGMDIKFLKPKKVFKKGGIHINPNIYWGVCVCVGLVIVIASIIFGFYLFKATNKELIVATSNENTQVQIINKEKIDKVLEYFAEREKKSSQILTSPATVVDPSR